MGSAFTMRSVLGLLFLCLVQLSAALHFDLSAVSGRNERCIRNFAHKDQLVVVTAIVGGTKGDGQEVNMQVCVVFCWVFVGGIGLDYWCCWVWLFLGIAMA